MATKASSNYKFRRQFNYRGKIIDIRSNDLEDFVMKYLRRKEKIDKQISSADMTFNRWKYEYLDTYKIDVSEETFSNYKIVLDHLDFPQPLGEIKPIHLQKFFNSYAGLSKSLIHKMYFLCKDIFERAVDNGFIEKNPCNKLIIPSGTENERRPLTDQEKCACIQIAANHKYGSYFMLMLFAGLRPIEASQVRGRDIDLDKKQLYVHGAKAKKGENKDRIVPICDPLIPFLVDVSKDKLVICDSNGNPLNPAARRHRWSLFKREVNQIMNAQSPESRIIMHSFNEDVTPYYLRHTFNVDCVSANVPWVIKEQFMGHSLKKQSLGYDHLTQRNIDLGRRLLNQFYSRNMTKVNLDRKIKR